MKAHGLTPLIVLMIALLPLYDFKVGAREDELGTLSFSINEAMVSYDLHLIIPVKYLKETEMGEQLDLAAFKFMRFLEVSVEGERDGSYMVCSLKSKLTLSSRTIARMAYGYFKAGNEEQIFRSLGLRNITFLDTYQKDNMIYQGGIAYYEASPGEIKQTINYVLNASSLIYVQEGMGEWVIKEGKRMVIDLNIHKDHQSIIGLMENLRDAELFADQIETLIEIHQDYVLASIHPEEPVVIKDRTTTLRYDFVPARITMILEPYNINPSGGQGLSASTSLSISSSQLNITNLSTGGGIKNQNVQVDEGSTRYRYATYFLLAIIFPSALIIVFKPYRLKSYLSGTQLKQLLKISK